MTAPSAASIACPSCNQPAESTQRFCGKCGESLWAPCPSCKAEGPVGSSFCGSCGANLRALQQERVEQIETRLQKVEHLESQHRYDEALQQLRIIADVKDDLLAVYKEQADEKIKQVIAARDRLAGGASTAYKAATKYLKQQAYEKALALLEVTPEPLRDAAFQQLHRECLTLCEEVKTLTNEIRECVNQKEYTSIGEKIDRLLELKPNHPQANDIASKLRVRFCQTAKKRITEERYSEALDWLCRIPETQRDEEIKKQTRVTTELLWMQTDLKTAAVANSTLAEVADRLQKAAPNSKYVQQQKQRIADRVKVGPEDPRWATPRWFSPQRTPFGCDVEWLSGCQSIECADTTLLKKHPGRFFTAIGLALQGIGCGSSDVNLLPKKQSLLHKLSFGSRQAKGPVVAWGIDLGTTALKAAKLILDSQHPGNKPQIERLEYLPHSQPLNLREDSNDDKATLRETLKAFAEKHDTKETKLCVSIAHKHLLCRFLDLPSVPDKRLAELLPHEVQHQIPFPLKEIVWDHHVLASQDKSDAEGPASMRVMILAAKKGVMEQHVAILESAGLSVDVVQSDCVALHSFAHHEFIRDQKNKDAAVVLVDVGTDSSNVVLSSQESAWFRSMSLGGNQVTKAIVRDFKLTNRQAEQLKQQPEKAKQMSRLFETIDPVTDRLVSELERNLALHAKDHPQIQITHLLCIGGGSALHGLLRRMRMGQGHIVV